MPIPDYQSLMLPLLTLAGGGEGHSFRQSVEELGAELNLSEAGRHELLPSGRYPVFDSRAGWASTYLRKAGLLASTRRGFFRITAEGERVLRGQPLKIDVEFLEQYLSFLEFQSKSPEPMPEPVEEDSAPAQTPEEVVEFAFGTLRAQLSEELLQQIMNCSPAFFERLVVDLLVRMGYGGSRRDAGQAIGKSGDGGIDGIIKEDALDWT